MPDRTTRLTIPIVVVTGVAAVGLGIGWAQQPPDPGPTLLPGAAAAPPAATEAAQSLGLVRVDYRFERQPGHASNQVAVWIEDAAGRHVRSLFATSFTAEGGYVRRPMSLPAWRGSARWEEADEDLVRSVARPAPESGVQSLYWDGLDAAGVPVPPGDYRVRVEGNLLWEQRVLFTGTVTVGAAPHAAGATAEYLPAGASSIDGMLGDVRAEFLPGQRLDPGLVTTYTRGS